MLAIHCSWLPKSFESALPFRILSKTPSSSNCYIDTLPIASLPESQWSCNSRKWVPRRFECLSKQTYKFCTDRHWLLWQLGSWGCMSATSWRSRCLWAWGPPSECHSRRCRLHASPVWCCRSPRGAVLSFHASVPCLWLFFWWCLTFQISGKGGILPLSIPLWIRSVRLSFWLLFRFLCCTSQTACSPT